MSVTCREPPSHVFRRVFVKEKKVGRLKDVVSAEKRFQLQVENYERKPLLRLESKLLSVSSEKYLSKSSP